VVDGVQLRQSSKASAGSSRSLPATSGSRSRRTWKVSSPCSTTTRSTASPKLVPDASSELPSASAISSKYDP
jgi:hypothetical protein